MAIENLQRIIAYFIHVGDDVAAEAFKVQLALLEAE